MREIEFEQKSKEATNRHLKILREISRNPNKEMSNKEIEETYSYLDFCWICEKRITFLDRLTFNIQHSFEGNSHKRNCNGK